MSIEKNCTLVIERTGNGYMVRSLTGQHEAVAISEIMVFQDMGVAVPGRDYQDTEDTLLGFIQSHFTDPKKS